MILVTLSPLHLVTLSLMPRVRRGYNFLSSPLVLQPPLPLQLFLPLQPLSPVLQPPWPLQSFLPLQSCLPFSASAAGFSSPALSTVTFLLVLVAGTADTAASELAAVPARRPLMAAAAIISFVFEVMGDPFRDALRVGCPPDRAVRTRGSAVGSRGGERNRIRLWVRS